MPLYLVERDFAIEQDMTDGRAETFTAYELDHEIQWIASFLSADKKRTYCLYEADDVDLLRKHAADLGLPADTIVEVSELKR